MDALMVAFINSEIGKNCIDVLKNLVNLPFALTISSVFIKLDLQQIIYTNLV